MRTKKKITLAALAVLLAGAAAFVVAQQPEGVLDHAHGISEDDPRWLHLERVVAQAEAMRESSQARVEVDPFDARRSLQQLIDDADDGDIVAYYKMVRRVADQRNQFKAAIAGAQEALDNARNRNERPPAR